MQLARGEELNVLRGVRAESRRSRLRIFPGGRVCDEPGCGTRLSVYNSRERCWQHEPPRSFIPVTGRPRGGRFR
jgi:hypothetical protein